MQSEVYPEAETTFKSIVAMNLAKTNPLLPATELQLAFCRYYQNDSAGMSNALTVLLNDYPGTPQAGEALYWLAYLMRNIRAYAAAAQYCEQIVSNYPTISYGPEAAYLIGECYLLDNQPLPAVSRFLAAYKAFPAAGYTVYALMRGAEVYLEHAQIEDWLEELKKLSGAAGTESGVLKIAKGAALQRAGKYAEAEGVFETLDPATLARDVAGITLALHAGVANGMSNFAQAAVLAEKALEACRESNVGLDEALFQLAQAQFAQRDWEKADGTLKELLDKCVIPSARRNALALLERADCLLALDQTDDIPKLCDDAVRLKPGPELSARSVLLKGDAMLKHNEYQKAAQFYQRATILYGKMPAYAIPAYSNLIACYRQLGLTEDVAKTQKQFEERYPGEAKK